jgi:hypothetical protein
MNNLKAGAASIVVVLNEDCFPNAECVGKHDDVYVRLVVLESNRRFAIFTADMPSIFPEEVEYIKNLLLEKAGVSLADSWVVASHSLSSPHTWPLGDNRQKDTPLPKALNEKPEMAVTAERINNAYRDAYNKAIETALSAMREASIGFGTSLCAINVNRNMYTVEGWWQGVNFDGFTDRTLTVLRVDDIQRNPIAVLYNYSIQPCVGAGPILPDEGKLSSSDVTGVACGIIEGEYEGCTAIFLPGATADQVPLYKINYCTTDRNGVLRTGTYGKSGYILMEEQGRMLANTVINTVMKIKYVYKSPEINSASRKYTVICQKRETDMSKMRPHLRYDYFSDGSRDMLIHCLVIGDIALVGMFPELDGITVCQIRELSPFKKIMAVTFVNGNAKSMPAKESYSLFHYTAMNSPFVEGSAELTRDTALELLSYMSASLSLHTLQIIL